MSCELHLRELPLMLQGGLKYIEPFDVHDYFPTLTAIQLGFIKPEDLIFN